jgi:hypothetical protein
MLIPHRKMLDAAGVRGLLESPAPRETGREREREHERDTQRVGVCAKERECESQECERECGGGRECVCSS